MAGRIAQKYGYDLDAKQLSALWKNATVGKESLQRLYDSRLYSQPGFDKEKHYTDWVKNNISRTLGHFKHLQAEPSPAEFRNLCRKIYLKHMSPFSYYISQSFQHMARTLNDHKIPWGIIANQGPNFTDILNELNGRLTEPIFPGDKRYPKIINAADDANSKPGTFIYRRALDMSPNRKNTVYVGVHPIVDQVKSGVPIRSILMTETMDQPISDIEHLSPSRINKLQHFRVKSMAELYRVLIPGVNLHDIPPLTFKDESAIQQKSDFEDESNSNDLYQMLLPEALSQDEHVQENFHLMHFYDDDKK
ncbi:hypothetical protein TRICI_004280 [Trichomonascus ciferrii]|uniref:Uncharacterized protein n=1 Tax=Trichomonascus ciferrii TaxID=44093 RepID=A0A642V6C7_9ASCO|nr:hypothetical protein TRICI_004280 [Trichomonascus ciferrii]